MAQMDMQIERLASAYLRHGGSSNRRRQVERLKNACSEVSRKFRIRDVRQLGKRHVHWHNEQLERQQHSIKSRHNYWLAWCLLWEWLERSGEPPRPRERKITL